MAVGPPTLRRVAVVVFAGVVALHLVGVTLTLLADEPLWPHSVSALLMLPFPVTGVLVAWRRPHNGVAWLCLTIGVLWGLEEAGWGAARMGFSEVPDATWPAVTAVVADAFVLTSLFLMATLLLLLFPDGHLRSPGVRRLAALSAVAIAATFVQALFVPETASWGRPAIANPLATPAIGNLDIVTVPLLFGCVIASLVVLVRRSRRASGVQRQQAKWLAASAAAAVVIWVLAIVAADVLDETVAVATTSLGFGIIPVGIGVAVLRFRLFEIDRLISRSVTYAVVVGMLAGVYASGVVGLRGLLPPQSDVAVAASTLAVVALFAPLRRRVQATVDRRFNRSRADGERELERFATRLRDELDLDELTGDVVTVAMATVQPATASVWLPKDQR